MTLALTIATPFYVVQCADRLLTTADRAQRAFDPAANKTIVYRASDGVAVISYAGLAYVDGAPTDEYLAELLWGARVHRGPDGARPAIGHGRRPNQWNMGQAERALQTALSASVFAAHPIGVTIAGWRRRKRAIIPFVIEIERWPGRAIQVTRSPRVFTPKQNFFLHRIGVDFDDAALMRRLRREEEGRRIGPSAREAQAVLLEAIKACAAQDRRVGPDVLSVVLPRPDRGGGEIFFHAARAWPARIETPTRVIEVAHADHTPWMVTPDFIAPPSAVVGRSITNMGGYEVTLHGAPPGNGLLALQTSLGRPTLRR